mmetsp:Transcript_50722/g.93826  ORF Transcript_50722/g.93826 Transcript_50722/m.93826 type:complete len:507 (-) Transcript_50722:68-1588(-)
MAGPDLDELFGEASHGPDSAAAHEEQVGGTGVPCRPHHALLHVVGLTLETELGEDVLGLGASRLQQYEGEDDDIDEEDVPTDRAVALLLISARAAFARRDWTACSASAAEARAGAFQLLTDSWRSNAATRYLDIWQCPTHKHCDLPEAAYMPLVLAELLLAVCAAAEGDSLAAVRHADVAFAYAGPGSARNATLLFSKCLADEVAASRPPCAGAVASASFVSGKPRCVSRPLLAMPVTPVERWLPPKRLLPDFTGSAIAAPDREELESLLSKGMPFVTKEPIESWPASTRWASLSYLDGVAGHHSVPVKHSAHDEVTFMTVSDFLANHLVPSCKHCNAQPGILRSLLSSRSTEGEEHLAGLAPHELFEQCPALRGDVPQLAAPFRQARGRIRRTSVWLGTHNVATANCCSAQDQCIVQIFGVRYAILFPPKAAKVFSKASEKDIRYHGGISEVDVEDKRLLKQHPGLAQMPAQVAELSPGDLLFIPRGWWHQIRSLSPACSVSLRF